MKWYETLYTNYGEQFDRDPVTAGTALEVDFIEQEIGRDTNRKILDVGCGTGRHAVELAARGYDVTGIDLSEAMLRRAKQKARERQVVARFLKKDARLYHGKGSFDLVLMLRDGAFGLMETDEMNVRILTNGWRSLSPGGALVLTVRNALFPLTHGGETEGTGHFDPLTLQQHFATEVLDDGGKTLRIQGSVRHYMPSEITWLLESLGFRKVDLYGIRPGTFGRDHPPTDQDREMLVIGHK